MHSRIKLGKAHFATRPARCTVCHHLFKNKRALQMHLKTHKDK